MKIVAVATVFAAVSGATVDHGFVKSLARARQLGLAGLTGAREQLSVKPNFLSPSSENEEGRRRLEDKQVACDQAFLGQCMPMAGCVSCFATLQTEGIDWATVTPDTPCHDVVDFLFNGNYCTDMKGNNLVIDAFCKTFDVCVAWYEGGNGKSSGGNSGGSSGNETKVDCSTLTECNWEGFHRGFIGDGICHENYPGCYNTAICNFDGGDCCKDTCSDTTSFAECGHDGWACRDPNSSECDSKLTSKCANGGSGGNSNQPDPNSVICASDEAKYRLVMFDSFGDGWDATKLTINPNDDRNKEIFNGGLVDGAQGTEFICLSTKPTCYHIDVSGGVWGNEVSWEIRPMGDGTKAIADGGAPMDCTFSVQGISCDRTCSGKPNMDPTDDPDYKTYKELYNCIQEKCLIQVGRCMGDSTCSPCFAQNAPEYCFANDNFNAVIDCGLCQCTDNYDEFCTSKQSGPGAVVPPKPDEQPGPKPCTAAETLQGSSAVLAFSKCTNFDQVGMMVTDFDENNFGALDTFEACSHSFQNDPGHGGKTAMFCMKILADAIDNPDPDPDSSAPKQAISSLANLIYHNAERFCECASKSSADCPMCPSFMRFKTLLYESLDACKALDEIDCDAWSEFYPKCKTNLETQFQQVDFRNKAQCDFVKGSCGDAGPFPAFRRLDCGREISKTAWDFYSIYARSCLQGDDGIPPGPAPTPENSGQPTPSSTPAPTPGVTATPKDNNKPYMPDDDDENHDNKPKPYVPSDDESKPDYNPDGRKTGTSHFWRNIVIIGVFGYGIYWYYKRNNDSFSFIRYRRAPRNFGSESEMMYNGLTMDTGSTSFEPPSLPPPPSAVDHPGGYL